MGISKKKRKNPGVGVDFKRVKSKVGRKLKRVNETNTDFKTKSINLPSQNIRESEQGRKDDTLVDIVLTKRMVSMAQLIPQCRHYSPKVRISAMQGILELLQSHEVQKTGSSLQQVLQCVLESLSDGNSRVRKLVLQVLSTLFKRHRSSSGGNDDDEGGGRGGAQTSTQQQGSLTPFVPLLLVHAFKTMTHLNHSVSLDGIDSLSVMLTELSGDISEQDDEFFRRLLQNFNAMLTQMFEESTNVESKSKFLVKLITCIEMALDMFRLRSSKHNQAGGEEEYNAEEHNYHSPGALARSSSSNMNMNSKGHGTKYTRRSNLYEESWEKMLHRKFPSEYENFMSAAGVNIEGGQIKCQEVQLLANLRKLMGIFKVHLKKDLKGEEAQEDTHVKEYFGITSRVVSCLFMLLSSYSDFTPEDVRSLLGEMGSLFPLTLTDGMDFMRKQQEDVLQFNLNCANLILVCIAYLHDAYDDDSEEYGLGDHHFIEIVLETMSTYTSSQLNLFLKNSSKKVATPLESKLLHSLVSYAVKALRLVKAETRVQLMEDIHKILKKSKHFSVRKVILQAISQRQSLFFQHCKEEDKLNWLLLIPKIIWEASKEKEKEICQLGAILLLKLLQCSKPIEAAQKQSLQMQFLPLFGIPTEKGTIWGPYVSLGSEFQSNMTSLLHYVEPLTEKLVKSLAICALHLGLSESSCAKLLGAVAFGARANPSLQLSFFSSLVLKGCQEKSPRSETIQRYICTSLKTSFSDYQGALALLGKFVMSNISSPSVPLLTTLLLIFDGVVTSSDFGSEDFVKSFTEIASTPLAYVLLMWAKSEVLQKQEEGGFSGGLDDMWRMVEKAGFLVPSLLKHLGAYMTDGSLSLESKVVLAETNDKVIRSHMTSTILYEMVKHNLVKCNIVQVKDELKKCLHSIEKNNRSILSYGKYVYIKDNFS